MNNMVVSETVLANSLPYRAWGDWAGMILSIGCAVHCAAMPLALSYLPSLGLSFLVDQVFHQWMAVFCFGVAAFAFIPGWRRHGSLVPAVWGAAGLLLLMTAAFGFEESCCVSCPANDAGNATATDLECTLCEPSESIVSNAAAGFDRISFTSLVTPLGGLLLVVGHVVNHVKSCNCQGSSCCLTETEGSQELGQE